MTSFFEGQLPQNEAFSNQNKGHFGFYVYYYIYITISMRLEMHLSSFI